MYATHNEGKSVVTERFFRPLIKSRNVWFQYQEICILINWVTQLKKYNNTYHVTIKMKPTDVKPKLYINYNKENNYKNAKLVIM